MYPQNKDYCLISGCYRSVKFNIYCDHHRSVIIQLNAKNFNIPMWRLVDYVNKNIKVYLKSCKKKSTKR